MLYLIYVFCVSPFIVGRRNGIEVGTERALSGFSDAWYTLGELFGFSEVVLMKRLKRGNSVENKMMSESGLQEIQRSRCSTAWQ